MGILLSATLYTHTGWPTKGHTGSSWVRIQKRQSAKRACTRWRAPDLIRDVTRHVTTASGARGANRRLSWCSNMGSFSWRRVIARRPDYGFIISRKRAVVNSNSILIRAKRERTEDVSQEQFVCYLVPSDNDTVLQLFADCCLFPSHWSMRLVCHTQSSNRHSAGY